MIVKLLTEHHLEFLSLKGSYRGSSESTLVKMSKCWKSHAAAHFKSYQNVMNDIFPYSGIVVHEPETDIMSRAM